MRAGASSDAFSPKASHSPSGAQHSMGTKKTPLVCSGTMTSTSLRSCPPSAGIV